MRSDRHNEAIAVFDMGGTWFRWGLYDPTRGLMDSHRSPAISYLSHPTLTAGELQQALVDFVVSRVPRGGDGAPLRAASISLGAPINAHDNTVLGSGPLWGPTAKPVQLQSLLREAAPDLQWHLLNDVTALLAPYMDDRGPFRKTLLITVSSGIGARLYDHRSRRVPLDEIHGLQGEIGHLVFPFELEGRLLRRQCECGGWNHMNAFASGRGIAHTLRELPDLTEGYGGLFGDSPQSWRNAEDAYRLEAFQTQLQSGNELAGSLLEAFVTPLARALASALSLDPEIDRIVITGGVAHGLGVHYREALQRAFLRDGLYQITARDPQYLTRRLHWEEPDDFAGLRGAGIYAQRVDERRN
jgi:2-epi-5-epi-valiolone 7-kinase